ncbi:MAG: 3-phosphoshikimate 1-carboxyvinyltransferase [Gemmatimonadaceae bacterium]
MTLGARLHVSGVVRVPGDKSISHRALMLAALATGRSTIRGILQSDDVASTARVLRTLGVALDPLGPLLSVSGRGLRGIGPAAAALDCGNSGTTARLMLGILAAQHGSATVVGDASLSRRPMRRVAEPLRAMGAHIETAPHDGLPVTVNGADLKSLAWTTPAASAQIKSAILLAGLCAHVPVTVHEPQQSRDHTERMLSALGVTVTCRNGAHGNQVDLIPAERLAAFESDIPGDPSSAAYFAALAAMAASGELALPRTALNPTRSGFFEVLRRMGADVSLESDNAAGEPTGTLLVRPSRLHATSVEGREVPTLIDELPLIACVAARAEGETVIRGAAELRLKESDRIAAVVANLRSLGVDAEELPDGMRIVGSDAPLGGVVRTHGDHRIAMAFATLGAAAGSDIALDDRECVAISYPGFWQDLERVCGAAA